MVFPGDILHDFCDIEWFFPGDILHDFCDIEWFSLEMNRDHSVTFEIASKYCISDSSIDSEGYSISFKKLLPTVVDIMVI